MSWAHAQGLPGQNASFRLRGPTTEFTLIGDTASVAVLFVTPAVWLDDGSKRR
jgi:hypothetical protein